jgi:hypothetical protein
MPLWTKNNISFCVLVALFSVLPLSLVAQGDSLRVELRSFARESIEKYKADSDFDYDREFRVPEASLWERVKRWLFERLWNSFSDDNRPTEKTILYVLLAAVVVFILLKLANVQLYNVFRGASARKEQAIAYSSLTKDMYSADLDMLVQEAIREGRYEQALRLLFLKALRLLSEKKYVQWKEPKTNGEYLRELAAHPALQEDFQRLRLYFDYTFYGDFHLDEARFLKMQTSFQAFYQKL